MLTIHTPEAPSSQELEQAAAIIARCNQLESLDLPITLEEGRPSQLLLGYHGQTLVGLADIAIDVEAEVCLCVDPAWRRRGYGRELVQAAARYCHYEGAHGWFLVADQAAASARSFSAALGAELAYAEHRLQLDWARLPDLPLPSDCHCRIATPDDASAVAFIIAAAFGDPLPLIQRFVSERLALPDQRFIVAEQAGQVVAVLRLVLEEGWVYITTFAVLPSAQGQGIGRFLLLATLNMLRSEGQRQVRIEVSSENPTARRLYESCGFFLKSTYSFSRLAL